MVAYNDVVGVPHRTPAALPARGTGYLLKGCFWGKSLPSRSPMLTKGGQILPHTPGQQL